MESEAQDRWEPAFSIGDRDQFIAARVAKLRGIAAKQAKEKFDKYFLVRQHAYFMNAYMECRCRAHSCSGCAITLGVASKLEQEISHLDPVRCEIEADKARALNVRQWQERRQWLQEISNRVDRLRAWREGAEDAARMASLRAARDESEGA